jgi:CHAT domain-containing protein
MVIKPGLTAPQIVPLCDGDELGYYLKFSDARDQDIYIQDRTAAYELYELLWKPLTPHLGGIKTVHFSPSGLGHQLAFSILVDESGKRLYRQYQLHHHTSLRDWLEGNKPIASKLKRSITVLGGANYNQRPAAALTRTPQVDRVLPAMRALNTWPALPGTGKERAAITGIFKSRQWQVQDLSGANASENRVKELSGRAPRIVHLATHGFFIPRPKDKAELKRINLKGSSFSRNVSLLDQPLLRSGLILAGGNLAWQQGGTQGSGKENGILTAFEIAGLDLTGTELVTLSACDTGLGDIFTWEGVFGLQRAFKIAGVDKLIISLWKVADDATLNFMESFYRHYLSGKTIHEAFRNTRLEMEEKYEPYFWAGFVLVE